MEFKIGHIAYRTQNMEAALDFYTGKLGFRHAFSIADEQGRPWIEYLLTPDGRFLELFYPEDGEKVTGGGSYMHLCLEVEDCAAAAAELEARGVDLWQSVKVGADGNYQAWIRDPDGREIELMQVVETSPQSRARKK